MTIWNRSKSANTRINYELPKGPKLASKKRVTQMRALRRHRGRVQIMGIVNRTPDSFFDGGSFMGDKAARARVRKLINDGADIIDVGAESTRPGAAAVSAEEQLLRIGDIIAYAVEQGACASVDTTSPQVAIRGLDAGATMINSVSLEPAAELGTLAARYDAELVLTHCRGSMTSMQGFSRYSDDGYTDVVVDVADEWKMAAERALDAGLDADALLFDPGLGFTKNAAQSLELCARLAELKQRVGHRVLVGPSRKSYIAHTVGSEGKPLAPPEQRLGGSIAAALDCASKGADIVRVHDVAEICQALRYLRAIDDELGSQLQSQAETPQQGGTAGA